MVLRVAEALTAGGLAGAVLGRRSRALSALSGVALLAASALTRFGIFEAAWLRPGTRSTRSCPSVSASPRTAGSDPGDPPASRPYWDMSGCLG
ncbi:MAG: hypothetical protein ACRDPF_07000 [Streptosporangiaceae bacterium]